MATEEILVALGRAGANSGEILDKIIERAASLCQAQAAQLHLADGALFRLSRVSRSISEEFRRHSVEHPTARDRRTLVGRVATELRTQQIADVLVDPDYGRQDLQRIAGYRTLLSAPMLLDDDVVGVLSVWRTEVRPFDEHEMELLSVFAAQAAIVLRQFELRRALEIRSAELASRLEQLEALREVGEAVSSSLDPGEVLDRMVTNAVRLTGTDGGSIMEYDEEADGFLVRAAYGSSAALMRRLRATTILRATTLVGRAVTERRPLQVSDLSTVELDPHLEVLYHDGWRSVLAVPMVRGDVIVGVLVIRRRSVGSFPEDMVELLETFASQSSVAIINARLFRELAQKVELLEALRGVGEAISSSLDLDEVLQRILASAVRLSGADGGLLIEYDESEELFDARTVLGASANLLDRLEEQMLVGDEHSILSLFGQAAVEGRVLEIADSTIGRFDPMAEVLIADGWRSVLGVPIKREQTLVGMLLVRRATPGTFPSNTTDLLLTLAAQSAIAIINARLFRELETKSAELSVASRHKSEFLASMSHELRTPLNAVIGFSEVLLDRLFGELNDRQDEYVRDIWNSGRHLLELLNEILDLSKVEAGQMVLETSRFQVAAALEYALSLVRERAAQHDIVVGLDVDPGVDAIEADELRFKQVVLNLVSNAVKFTPDAGRVDVRAWRDDDELTVTVTDTGAGVPEADRERIFESFQQGGRGVTREEGTGLGLTLSRRIVELFGGRLWLESEVGVGSTFGFALPVGPVRASAAVSTTTRDPARATVLLVDDDRSSLDLVSAYLEGTPARVELARDGVEALRMAEELRPAAVVLDIRLPGLDGWQVLATLRERPETRDIPVVIATVVDDRARGAALGADAYLLKPVGREEMLAALVRVGAWPAEIAESLTREQA